GAGCHDSAFGTAVPLRGGGADGHDHSFGIGGPYWLALDDGTRRAVGPISFSVAGADAYARCQRLAMVDGCGARRGSGVVSAQETAGESEWRLSRSATVGADLSIWHI